MIVYDDYSCARQAEKFQVQGVNLNGKLTCGENIADLGGVKLALRALQKSLAQAPAPLINGFTPEQRLFLAWSQSWRENGSFNMFLFILLVTGYYCCEEY